MLKDVLIKAGFPAEVLNPSRGRQDEQCQSKQSVLTAGQGKVNWMCTVRGCGAGGAAVGSFCLGSGVSLPCAPRCSDAAGGAGLSAGERAPDTAGTPGNLHRQNMEQSARSECSRGQRAEGALLWNHFIPEHHGTAGMGVMGRSEGGTVPSQPCCPHECPVMGG